MRNNSFDYIVGFKVLLPWRSWCNDLYRGQIDATLEGEDTQWWLQQQPW